MPEVHIAALWAPDWPLQALVRAEPERAGVALAVDGGSSETGGVLVAVTPRAHAAGVRPGMRASAGRVLCPELVVLRRDPELERSATEALRDAAFAFSPRVELDEVRAGWAYLDVTGLERLVGPAATVARGLARAGEKLGLGLRVGIARTKTLARLVARAGEGCQVLPADVRRERRFLDGLPLSVLEPDPATAAALTRFGLTTVAELRALPRERLAARLGPGAARLYRRAVGEEEGGGLAPMARPADYVERILLDWAIAELEPLAFVLKGLLDRLVARLSLAGLVAGDLHLSLAYEAGGGCERSVRVASPTRDVRALLELCRVHLSEHPPEAAVQRVAASVTPEALRPRQLSFFAPAGPAPEKLAVTLARLHALCGPDRVGAPRPLDSWVSDRFVMSPFELGTTAAPPEPSAEQPPPRTLRRFRPPLEIEVLCAGERPTSVSGRGFAGGRVVSCQGPYRRSRPWWETRATPRTEAPSGGEPAHTAARTPVSSALRHGVDTAGSAHPSRGAARSTAPPPVVAVARGDEAWDVTLGDGRAYRLSRDPREERWVVEGWYD